MQWEHQGAADATWEAEDDLRRNFPTFHLEDKVSEEGEATVTKGSVDQVKRGGVGEKEARARVDRTENVNTGPRMSNRVNRGVTNVRKYRDFIM